MHERNFRLNCTLALSFAFIFFLLLLLLPACSAPPTRDDFKGTVISGEKQAPDFELTDQLGRPVSLRKDFDGKVVLLTFLYTECPDVCPIVANHLRDISELVEDDRSETAIVIVSVDPVGDRVDTALAFLERWRMADRWTYLVGDDAELKPIWEAYYIDPYIHGPGRGAGAIDRETEPADQSPSGGVSALVQQSGRIIHSAPIYVIDEQGIMRSLFTLPLEPQDVAHDMRLVRR